MSSLLELQVTPPSALQINGFFRIQGAVMMVDGDLLGWLYLEDFYPYHANQYPPGLMERIINETASKRCLSPLTVYLEILQAPITSSLYRPVSELWKELSQGDTDQPDRGGDPDDLVSGSSLRLLGKT